MNDNPIQGLQNEQVALIDHKCIVITSQAMKFRMDPVAAHASAEVCSRVRDRHSNCIGPNRMVDGETVTVGTAIGRNAEIHDELILKLVGET